MKIEELGLSPRTANALGRAGIREVEQLRGMTEQDLLRLRGIGVGCIQEIRQCLCRAVSSVEAPEEMGEVYTKGYDDGYAAALRDAASKLTHLACTTKGSHGEAFRVAAAAIDKTGGNHFPTEDLREDSGLLSED